MKKINKDVMSKALLALLEGKTINRKHYNNASLHSWISDLRNRHCIPIESIRTYDGTSDYYMLPEEIKRYIDPEQRKQQRQEVQEQIRLKRLQKHNKKVSHAYANKQRLKFKRKDFIHE